MLRLGEKTLRSLHFVGVGGAGMSAIAHVALELGVDVSGSDLVLSDVTARLAARGARVSPGHAAANLGTPDAVVVSSAIARDNAEVLEAKSRGIPVLHRAEMLAAIMDCKKGIAVSGTHGKTTTAAMLAVVFTKGGLEPTWLVGGEVRDLGGGAAYGEGEYLIAEADESDASFLKLNPLVAVATNVDNDHLDHYGRLERIVEAFKVFLSRTRPGGFGVLCSDDRTLAGLLPELPGRVVTYGLDPAALPRPDVHYQATGVDLAGWGSSFTVQRLEPSSGAGSRGTDIGRFALRVPGRHNVSNALAAVAVSTELGLDTPAVSGALRSFTGAGRRLERRGQESGVAVVDDYAHHPTEIAATLRTVRQLAGQGRVVVAFQPHRFTRTRDLYREFGRAFTDADVVVLTDIYPASETPLPGVTGELIYRHFEARPGQAVAYVPALGDVPARLVATVRPGDLVVTMGAGNVWRAGLALLSLLAGPGGASAGP